MSDVNLAGESAMRALLETSRPTWRFTWTESLSPEDTVEHIDGYATRKATTVAIGLRSRNYPITAFGQVGLTLETEVGHFRQSDTQVAFIWQYADGKTAWCKDVRKLAALVPDQRGSRGEGGVRRNQTPVYWNIDRHPDLIHRGLPDGRLFEKPLGV